MLSVPRGIFGSRENTPEESEIAIGQYNPVEVTVDSGTVLAQV